MRTKGVELTVPDAVRVTARESYGLNERRGVCVFVL